MAAKRASFQKHLAGIKPVPASVQLLEKQLTSGEPTVRDTGLASITKVRPPAEALTDLIAKLMEHQNWYVRRTAAAAITKCAEIDDSAQLAVHNVAALRLAHKDPEVRKCAARALIAVIKSSQGKAPPPSCSLGVLREELEENKKSLDESGEPSTDAGSDTESISSEDSMFGVAEADAIAEPVGQLAVEEIARCLDHKEAHVRTLAIESLNRLGSTASVYAKKLAALTNDPDVSVRNAATASFKILGAYCNDGIETVAGLMRNPNYRTRNDAKKLLHIIKAHSGKRVAEAVYDQLVILDREKSPSKQKARVSPSRKAELAKLCDWPTGMRFVMTTLCELGELCAPYLKLIADYIEHKDVEIRGVAVRTLIAGGAEVANNMRIIRSRLTHPDPDVSRAALDVLRGLGPLNPTIATNFGKLLQEDSEGAGPDVIRMRYQALKILGGCEHHTKRFLSDIARELEHGDFQIRRGAMETLIDLKQHAVPAGIEVSRRLLHADPVVRRTAVETLGRMGVHAGEYMGRVEGLVDTEEDPDVQKAIAYAVNAAKETLGENFKSESPKSPKARKVDAKKQDRRISVAGGRRLSASGVSSPASPLSPKSPKKKD